MLYIILLLAYAVDPVLLYHVCFTFLKPKYQRKIYYIGMILAYYGVILLKQSSLLITRNSIVSGLSFPTMLVVITVFIGVLFYGSIKQKGTYLCMHLGISIAVEGIAGILCIVLKISADITCEISLRNIAFTAVIKVCQIVVYLLIVSYMLRRRKKVLANMIVMLIIYSVILMFFLLAINYFIQKSENLVLTILTYSIQVSLVTMFTLYAVNIITKTENSKDAAMKRAELLESKIRLIENNKKINEELRALRHDMKAHFKMIKDMAELDKTEELKEYMNECYAWVEKSEAVYVGENTVLMTLVNEMIKRAGDNGIKFERTITTEDIPLSDFEQGVVLSNILNNAIEANLSGESQDKFIQLEIKKAGGDTLILCNNSFSQELHKSNHQYVTSKQDKENHGIGIRNVKKIIKKHNGKLEQWNENNIFYTQVRLVRE